MFEPFYSTKAMGKGSGMGLAVVHGIVHEHGGHVVVEAPPGRVRLPDTLAYRCGRPQRRSASGAERPGASRCATSLRGGVLVVEDEQSVAEFMRELLGSWGLEVSGPSPEAALAMLRETTQERMTSSSRIRRCRG